jgi:hypothetical protein
MRLSYLMLSTMLLAGCASRSGLPVATAKATPIANDPTTSVEVRHMYLFAPGKTPVLIVDRDDGSSAPQEVSSEPPER